MVSSSNKRRTLSWSFSPLLFLLLSNWAWSQQEETSKKVPPDSANSTGDSLTQPKSYITVAANSRLKGSGLKKMLMGKNYRKEWTQPVQVPVINLAAEQIKPTKEGGGKQTRSLKAEDQNGNQYSLRSIKKYPEKAVPEELKNSIAEKIVADGISASYPYAAFSMEVLSTAAGVPYLKRKLVWLGDDPALGEFRSKYKNALVQLEESKPSGHLPSPIATKDKIESFDTEEVILKLQASSKYKVDQVSVLKARLLDNFVMNFDRHEGQWDWTGYDSLGSGIFVVIPKDGDQVFFINQGLLPKIAKGTIPEIQGFRKNAKDQVTFNRSAINFDNFFLNSLNEEQWRSTIEIFLQSMTDSVIELALHQQPKEVHQYAVPKIIRTLKARRKYFMKDMMKYYDHLAKEVSIIGSNEAEFFKVFTDADGRMLVTITGEHGNGMYERVFDPKVTKEIRLYGLEGNDQFQIDGENSPINIRIIGGPGEDQFINNADEGKIWVYDLEIEQNSISGSHEVKNRMSADPLVNEYKRLGYVFDRKGLGINSEVGFDGGLYVGLRYRSVTHGFRKEPYAARHDFIAGHELALNSWLFRYNADLIKTFGKTDLLIRSEYFMPTARTNFFGLGNESVYDKSNGDGIQYYRARYELANISVLARSHINSWIDIRYGPSFQYFKLRKEENEGKYITRYDHTSNGDDPHQSHVYAGGELQFNIDTRNNVMIPTRGIELNTSIRSLMSVKGSAKNLTQLNSIFSFYSDFLAKDHLVLATRFGLAHNIGEYEFVQANYLGFRENLRGYRIHRFGGRTSAYNNLELRWKIGEMKTFLCPISVGLIAFNDVGRVWIENESSSTWHNGYGGGIWIAPINKIVITGTLSYSDEEKNLPWITIGFQF